MKTTLKRIQTKDNIELVGLLFEPDTSTKKILIHVHGMGGNFYENRFLDSIVQNLTDNDIAFFAFNNRGCEIFKDLLKTTNSTIEIVRIGNAYEKFEESQIDISAAIDEMSKLGFSEIHLSGHSLGSPKVAYYLAQTNDQRVNSVLFLSPSDMLGLVRSDMKKFQMNISEATKMVTDGKGNELLSLQVWGEYPISASTYLSLFADDSKAGIFNFHDPNDKLEVLNKIKQPNLDLTASLKALRVLLTRSHSWSPCVCLIESRKTARRLIALCLLPR
jgi:pimeloyl-ACP methyl ester carboxylesterase